MEPKKRARTGTSTKSGSRKRATPGAVDHNDCALRSTLKLALTTAGDDDAAITIPALYTTNLDCRPIVSGKYWVQIDTAATASEAPIVVIFGR